MGVKKGFKWDGKTRVSNETYRKNFNEIFNKKKKTLHEDLVEGFEKEQEELEKEELLQEIADRNGF